MHYQFKIRYNAADIQTLAARYLQTPYKSWTAGDEDRLMEEAGWRLVNGSFDVADVFTIILWKSHRPVWLFEQNAPAVVETAIKDAIAATRAGDMRRAVQFLTRLSGVGVKMASAVLTALFPNVYTVCDVRASEALGQRDLSSLRYYVAYLTACARMAAEHGVSLRDLDRANWQWSKEQSNKHRKRRCRGIRLPSGGGVASVA
jgi:hypothetical protein